MRRGLAVVLVAVVASLGAAGPASAHERDGRHHCKRSDGRHYGHRCKHRGGFRIQPVCNPLTGACAL